MLKYYCCIIVTAVAAMFGNRAAAQLPADPFASPSLTVTISPTDGSPAQPVAVQPQSANNPAQQPPKTPEQQRTELLQNLAIDRTNSGILQARLEARREQEKADAQEESSTPSESEQAEAEWQGPLSAAQYEAAKQQEDQKKLAEYKKDVQAFRRDVILGEWENVRKFLEALPDGDAQNAFNRVVQQLGSKVQVNPRPELATLGAPGHEQEQFLRCEEILALSDAAKAAPDKNTLQNLAKLIDRENPPPPSFFRSLENGTRYFGPDGEEARHRTAELLVNAGFLDEAAIFLPDVDKAREDENMATLNLISRFHAEAHRAEKGKEHLPEAWRLCLHIISERKADLNQRGEALYRALSLVPELEDESGKEWLKQTFSDVEAEGFEILAAVGTLASQTREHQAAEFRLEQLELQAAAVSALLGNEGIDLEPWRETLTLYARNWIAEAGRTDQLDSSNSMRPHMQIDNYGNIFYANTRTNYTGTGPAPIQAGDVLRARPTGEWLNQVDELVHLETLTRTAELFLKVKEEEKAFPLLGELAKKRPEGTKDLVREMIRVWAENNNPNQQSRYRSTYYYYYGYNQRAESIPLTRSKQERNLDKLAKLIEQVRALNLDENFEEEFADAFIQAHSQAEVWRVESLETVFGPLDQLDPDTISSLLRRMRANLANLWPDPRLQEQAKTKRKDKEQEAQILHGYAAASLLCEEALEQNEGDWPLMVQLAAIGYEESNYRASLGSHPDHSANKRAALEKLARAANTYTDTLPLEDQKDESIEPFTTWFYAALGSPDLAALKADHQPVPAEYEKIAGALASLPSECRDRHLEEFANTLNNRLANVSPDLKYRFLEAALPITGEHERIEEAAKVFQYYQDLVTEIVLDVRLDGQDEVAVDEPFGLYVNLRHTKEIERESGGFQRYLVNQNNQPYAYNYGRPTEDYRDKFEKGVAAVLEEHFEILSLTFHSSKTESRTDPQPGWRYTPYAYFLLGVKGPEIDTIPPLRIDLDFLDTSGYVVLPVTSAAIPIAATPSAASRPYRDLELTLILDDREAEEKGRIYLEIRATAKGLVPPLDELIALPIGGFEIADTEDRGLQVEELTTDTDDGAPLSTHEWRLTLTSLTEDLPSDFQFPKVLATTAEEDGLVRQKYDDVDLITVEETVRLAGGSLETSSARWLLPAGFLLLLGLGGGTVFFVKRRNTGVEALSGPEMPQTLTPVTLLSFLDRVSPFVPDERKAELGSVMESIQASAFGRRADPPPSTELRAIALQWRDAASGGSA